MATTPKRKVPLFLKIVLGILAGILVIGFIGSLFMPSEKEYAEAYRKEHATNMDSVVRVVKKDSLYEIKDAYYNPKDSSFNISFTNKDEVITDKDYSTVYFNDTYHLDSLNEVEGIYLYAYRPGKSLFKGDYSKPLTYDSKRLARITQAFDEKYFSEYRNSYTPVYDYLHTNLDDHSSLEIIKFWNLGMNADSTFEIKETFRAKNAFGALILQTINCNVDKSGNVTNVEFNK